MPAVPITIPSVGESITEGILARWLKADGSKVLAGEPLFELETDKANSVVPSPGAGVLVIKAHEGDTVAIGGTIGTIEPLSSAAPEAASKSPEAPESAAPAPNLQPETAAPVANASSRPLSPSVRRLAGERGVDVARVEATGPGGRITKGDVIAFLESPGPDTTQSMPPARVPDAAPGPPTAPAPAAPAPAAASARAGPRETRQRFSGLRQRIAERMVEAQKTAAILTTFNEADMSRVLELRTRYKDSFQAKHGVGLGFMSFFVKAVIDALKAFPVINARIDGSEIVHHHFYDIGVAVSTDRGLVVPVIRDAQDLSFAAIEQAVAGFAAKARAGTITVDDLRGGTFTITNGGVFGSLLSTPILNPPQSAILGMHAIKKRPVAVDDQIAVRPVMYLALSYDHRLIDGREAVSFLVRVKDCIENPERLMFEI
jgi:2-oxoglutarate dehydrogenase E2 component (dihydrolipoamide succinyltransferase)